jgi:hypothetical protein
MSYDVAIGFRTILKVDISLLEHLPWRCLVPIASQLGEADYNPKCALLHPL